MRYVGKYRVMSEIDKTTNDFPKEWHTRQNGEIEKTNCDNDIYIVCKNNCKILNYGKGKLIFYCPSIKRFNNITKEINTKDKSIIIEQRISDKEGWFYFKAENIEKIEDIVGISTYGAKRSPFSAKNLPKNKYEIPEEDMLEYKKTINLNEDNKIQVMQSLKQINKLVVENLKKKNPNVKEDMRLEGLGIKEYLHKHGKWSIYLDTIRKNLK